MTEKQDLGSPITRRALLRAGAVFAAGGVAGGFLSKVGEGVYHSIFPELTGEETDRSYLSSLFDLEQSPPSIYAGSGNILGRAVGIKDVSGYLRFAASTLVDFISNTLDIDRSVFDDNGDVSFQYDPQEQAVFLGSPVSNPISRHIMGYMPVASGDDSVPQVDFGSVRTRWSFLFGESEFGVYEGQREVAGRYSKRTSELVYRPVYKLVDKHNNKTESPSITGGMLDNEWLTIIKMLENGKPKTLIAGMHGTGTELFFTDFHQSIEKLHELTKELNEYQVIAPVQLDHAIGLDGVRRTIGQIDWKHAQLHGIG